MLLNRGYINQQTAREYSFDVSESDAQLNGGMPGAKPPYAAAMNRR